MLRATFRHFLLASFALTALATPSCGNAASAPQVVYRLERPELMELDRKVAVLQQKEAAGELSPDEREALASLTVTRDKLTKRLREVLPELMATTLGVLQARFSNAGIGGVGFHDLGDGRIGVTLPPGVTFDSRIARLIESPGTLLFRVEARRDEVAVDGRLPQYPANPDPARYRWLPITHAGLGKELAEWSTAANRRWVLVEMDPQGRYPVCSGADLSSIYVERERHGGKWAVGFAFSKSGAISAMTEKFLASSFPIDPPSIFVILDDEIVWGGVINAPIRAQGRLTGFDSAFDAEMLVNLVNSGALPLRLVPDSPAATNPAPIPAPQTASNH